MFDPISLSTFQAGALADFAHAVRTAYPGATIKVFGSAISGPVFSFSDIDVAVVSESFARMPWNVRGDRLKLLTRPGSPMSPIGVTPSELDRSGHVYPSILRAIKFGQDLRF